MIQRTDNRMLGRGTTTILGATAAHQKERSERRCDTEAAAYCTLEGQAAEIRGGGVYCTKEKKKKKNLWDGRLLIKWWRKSRIKLSPEFSAAIQCSSSKGTVPVYSHYQLLLCTVTTNNYAWEASTWTQTFSHSRNTSLVSHL